MAGIVPSLTIVNPSFIEPGIIIQYNQASGAFETVADRAPLVKLSEGDLYVYMKTLQVRTRAGVAQSAGNNLPSASVVMGAISTPTYMQQVRAEWDNLDVAAAGRWGLSLPEAHRLAMRQSHFQLARTALLYGFNAANGEGLVNTNGATATSLPADTNGNTTVRTYDNGQMAFWLLSQISAIKSRTNQLGIPRRFVILLPQQEGTVWQYSGIVSLTQFQHVGAGSATTAGLVKTVLEMNGDEIVWAYDDTLIGKGAGGTDAVLLVMPELEKPRGGKINTNVFAEISPGVEACTAMYADKAAPTEIPTPLAGGATDVVSQWRITSGWAFRPEAVTVLSMTY
jgi:hypothetical protein